MRRRHGSSKSIGSNLRKIRMQKGMMQIDVAIATDLHRTYVSRIETGQARITFTLLCRLVKGLEITSNELIEDRAVSYAQYIVKECEKKQGGEDNS